MGFACAGGLGLQRVSNSVLKYLEGATFRRDRLLILGGLKRWDEGSLIKGLLFGD